MIGCSNYTLAHYESEYRALTFEYFLPNLYVNLLEYSFITFFPYLMLILFNNSPISKYVF